MWQPARLDFAAGAICHDGIEQRRGDPEVLLDGGHWDTHAALPNLTKEEQACYEVLVSEAKAHKQGEAEAIRNQWLVERGKVILANLGKIDSDATDVEAREIATQALTGQLIGEFALILEDGRTVP